MEYSIGSLADLITGSDTPNKKKVIKKVKSEPEPEETQEASFISTDETEQVSKATKKKKSKSVSGKTKTPKTFEKESKVVVKRKVSETDENEPAPKKSKNAKNAERRIAFKGKAEKETNEEDPEVLARTVFVGNLPISSDTKKLKQFFSKYGSIESVRIRGVPVANPKMSKKVALIKKEFHPKRTSFYGFIKFQERDDAVKATKADGTVYQDHHLRVHLCDDEEKPDENKAIFVGNLSFYAEEEDLWNTFESCGAISSVRIVRDSKTGMGKGIGYVNFKDSGSVTLALEMEDVTIKDRQVRISACNRNAAKKGLKKKMKKPKQLKPKQKEVDEGKIKSEETSENTKANNNSFQGVKFLQKKKKKFNKGLFQKQIKSKQIAPSSK